MPDPGHASPGDGKRRLLPFAVVTPLILLFATLATITRIEVDGHLLALARTFWPWRIIERSWSMDRAEKDKLFADLWLKQSDILLKGTSLLPVAEAAISAGWYVLAKDRQLLLAQCVAGLGAFAMAMATLYMARTVHYASIFRRKITGLLGVSPPHPFLSGRAACLSVPILFTVTNIAMIFFTSSVVPAPVAPLIHLLPRGP
jgi:hypothetical protein